MLTATGGPMFTNGKDVETSSNNEKGMDTSLNDDLSADKTKPPTKTGQNNEFDYTNTFDFDHYLGYSTDIITTMEEPDKNTYVPKFGEPADKQRKDFTELSSPCELRSLIDSDEVFGPESSCLVVGNTSQQKSGEVEKNLQINDLELDAYLQNDVVKGILKITNSREINEIDNRESDVQKHTPAMQSLSDLPEQTNPLTNEQEHEQANNQSTTNDTDWVNQMPVIPNNPKHVIFESPVKRPGKL